MSLVFENTDTMRWQVQEMARAERMLRDDQIETEIATYNELIPEAFELSATMLIELQAEEQLREWLPKLVGIHRAVVITLPDGSQVRGVAQDEDRLTRENTTPAVHFLKFAFAPAQVETFAAGPVRVGIDLPAYLEEATLTDAQHTELLADLRG